MASSAPIDKVLETFQLIGISVSDFVLELLTNKKYNNHIAVKDILYNRQPILNALFKSAQDSSRTKLKWATDLIKDICAHVSYPIYLRFSSEVLDTRSNQIQSTDPYWIHYNKLLHSYPVHITLNTAYFLHLVLVI